MPKPRKPKTVTGRVANLMCDALEALSRRFDVTNYEYTLMLAAAQATTQGLDPVDFDNEQGVDAFAAIFAMVSERDRATIHVTPEWRRVVISARRQVPTNRGDSFWRWRAKTNEATRVSVIEIPTFASSS